MTYQRNETPEPLTPSAEVVTPALTGAALKRLIGSAVNYPATARSKNWVEEVFGMIDALAAREQDIIARFLERTGQYVTNDASREAAISEAIATGKQGATGYGEDRSNPMRWVDGVPVKAGNGVFVYPPTPSLELVASVYRGGGKFGRATVMMRWEAGAEKLPDGEHKLYACKQIDKADLPIPKD